MKKDRKNVDELIADLESRGLGWSLDHTAHNHIEARIWKWPYVIARKWFSHVVPLDVMLAEAMSQIDWSQHPVK